AERSSRNASMIIAPAITRVGKAKRAHHHCCCRRFLHTIICVGTARSAPLRTLRVNMKIRLAENFRAVFYAPFYATQALGLFAAEGLDVELVASAKPGEAIARALDGTIDLTWGGPMRVMKARDRGADSPLVCFGEVVARDPFYLVGRADIDRFGLADLT